MESNANQDPAALALQIQTLTANVGELTRQNQEISSDYNKKTITQRPTKTMTKTTRKMTRNSRRGELKSSQRNEKKDG